MPAQRLRCGPRTLDLTARTLVMAVVNATSDSFSGDGTADDVEAAVALARRFVAEGADIVDVGGESTRPRSERVPADEEAARVVPVIARLRDAIDTPISIDTHKAAVAAAAIDAGATMVNDVWGLRRDPAMAPLLAAHPDIALVAMHNHTGTAYGDVVHDVIAGLRESLAIARDAGIDAERIVVDPGFGFGKTPAQNLEVVRGLRALHALDRPLLIGASRKSTIGVLTGAHDPQERVAGGIAFAVLAAASGVSIVRTHDVAPTVQALRVADAVLRGTPSHVRDLPAPGQTG